MSANLILTAGLPASGKSSFSEYASEELGIPLIEKDRIKEYLFDYVGFRSHEEKTKLDLASVDIMLYTAATILDRGGSVILDSNFESRNTAPLEKLISDHPCNVITVRFDGDIEAIFRRFLERNRNPERHPGHVHMVCYPPDGNTDDTETIKSAEEFGTRYRQRGTLDFRMGKVLEVDVSDFSAVSYPDILDRLRAEMA